MISVRRTGGVAVAKVAVVGPLQFELAPPQLLVLHLQLDLVDLEFMQKSTGGLVRPRHRGSASELRLRIRPELPAVIGLELSCRVVPLLHMLPLARLPPQLLLGTTPREMRT